MKKHLWIAVALAAGCLVGCGSDGSGVDSSKPLSQLNADEARSVCEYILGLAGPERTVDCGGGVTVNIGASAADIADCATDVDAATTCTATVGQAEDCFAALAEADPCSETPSLPPACAPVLVPGCTGGGR